MFGIYCSLDVEFWLIDFTALERSLQSCNKSSIHIMVIFWASISRERGDKVDLHIRPTLERLLSGAVCVVFLHVMDLMRVYSMYIYIFFLHEVAKHLILHVCVYILMYIICIQ